VTTKPEHFNDRGELSTHGTCVRVLYSACSSNIASPAGRAMRFYGACILRDVLAEVAPSVLARSYLGSPQLAAEIETLTTSASACAACSGALVCMCDRVCSLMRTLCSVVCAALCFARAARAHTDAVCRSTRQRWRKDVRVEARCWLC
jgi:hypothetical protein